MAISLLQSNGTFTNSDTSAGITTNFGGNTTAGSTLVVASLYASFAGLSVSDTSSDKFVQQYSSWLGNGTWNLQVWTANNIAGGNVGGVKVSASGAAVNLSMIVFEYSGVAMDITVDKTKALGNNLASIPSTGNTALLTYSTETAIAIVGSSTAANQTVGSGYGNLNNQLASASCLSMEDKNVTGDRTVVSGDFGTSTTNWSALVLTLVPADHQLYKQAWAGNRGLRPHPFSPGLAR